MVTLVFIAGDEADNIPGFLNHHVGMVDNFVCYANGPTADEVIAVIDATLAPYAGVKNWLCEKGSWEGFAHARNVALSVARETFPEGAHVMLDVDWVVHGDLRAACKFVEDELSASPNVMSVDTANLFVTAQNGSVSFERPLITRAEATSSYHMPLHEYLGGTGSVVRVPSGTCHVSYASFGHRSKQANLFEADIATLENFLDSDGLGLDDEARAVFYLAQSYRDAGKHAEAYETYWERSEVTGYGYWQERYISLLNMSRIGHDLKHSVGRRIGHLVDAIVVDPSRIEAYVEMSRLLSSVGMYVTAEALQRTAPREQSEYALFDEPLTRTYWRWREMFYATLMSGLDASSWKQALVNNYPGDEYVKSIQ